MVDIQTEGGVPLAHFAAPSLEVVRANLRAFLVLHCLDTTRKVVVRIWDRTELKYISLSGAEVNQVGGWIPSEVTVHVGSANL